MSDQEKRPLRVVVADDDSFTVSMVGDALRTQGFEVLTASTASDAWQMMGSGDPHALVSDLNFGIGTSGATLLRRVRAEYPWVGLVVLTSHLSPELAVEDSSALPDNIVYLVKSQLKSISTLGDAVMRSINGNTAEASSTVPAGTFIITAAQAEVMRMLAGGSSTKAVAEARGTTVRAAETMLARLYAALELGSDADSNPRVAAVQLWQAGRIVVR